MTAVLGIIVVLLFGGLLLLFGAVLELHRQVHQIRQHIGLLDQALVLEHETNVLRSELPGFEGAMAEPNARSAVLILSDTCSTCYEISASLGGHLIPELVAVMAVRSDETGQQWLQDHALAGFDNVFLDHGEVADRLGLQVTPSIVRFEGLRPVSATTVPSIRQLKINIDWLVATPGKRDRRGKVYQTRGSDG